MKSSAQNPMRKDYLVANVDSFAIVLAALCDLGTIAVGKIDEDDSWAAYRDGSSKAVNLLLDMLILANVDPSDLASRVTDSLSDMFPNSTKFNRDEVNALIEFVFITRATMVNLPVSKEEKESAVEAAERILRDVKDNR